MIDIELWELTVAAFETTALATIGEVFVFVAHLGICFRQLYLYILRFPAGEGEDETLWNLRATAAEET